MKFTLVVSEKKIMRFYLLEVAKLYQQIFGGVVFERKDDGDTPI